jgi:hypothetical protein
VVVQVGSPNFLRLPLLFWVLRNDVVETLLHAARNALDHLWRRSAPERMGPVARVAVPACSVDMMAPTWGLSAGHTHSQEFGPDNPLNVPFRRQ